MSAADSFLSTEANAYLAAALRGDCDGALEAVRRALDKGLDLTRVYTSVLQDSQYEVGRLWEAGAISVASEHLATATTQSVMTELYSRFRSNLPHRGSLAVCGVEGELHQVGAMMVANVLDLQGWDTRFLGTGLPHPEIIEELIAQPAGVLGISVTLTRNLPAAARLIQSVRQCSIRPGPHIVVGGAAFRICPSAVSEIGADGFASDLTEAIQVIESLAA